MDPVSAPDRSEIAVEWTVGESPIVLVHGAIADHRSGDQSRAGPVFADHCAVYGSSRREWGPSGYPDSYGRQREARDVTADVDVIDEPVTLLGRTGGDTPTPDATLPIEDRCGPTLSEPAVRLRRTGV